LQLKKHGIHQLIVIGLIAHTCVEATVRYAAELGYEVTVVSDAIADYSDVEMRAALEVNIPNYASSIESTNEILKKISVNRKTIRETRRADRDLSIQNGTSCQTIRNRIRKIQLAANFFRLLELLQLQL
jgi:hypothetical protein